MHESAYMCLYDALNQSSCESHFALKIIMHTTDQWKETNTKKRKKKGERDDIRIKEKRIRSLPLISDVTPCAICRWEPPEE